MTWGSNMFRRSFTFCLSIGLASSLFCTSTLAGQDDSYLTIKASDYQQKVYASWLGQMIGNFYGLSYEFKFIDQSGPNKFPYGYGVSLDRIREVNGAFSDDDTDIEYMYLLAMEKHGVTPTYRQLAKYWQYHVKEKVWAANRAALTLMHAGFSPPLTGNKNYNSEWFQIDPQLVNEIWAVTSPGMLDYASAKTAWAAKITNDSFGIEPAIHYAAMYSAAFFETDINTLIDLGNDAIDPDSRFYKTVEHMRALHKQYPNDWQQARKIMAEHYAKTFDYNLNSWVAIDANLNGACAILALLYGEGDFQKTLDMSSAIGFDADNQAATLSGLLAIMYGIQGIPDNLLYPVKDRNWDKPFNDQYINVSRFNLPDARISDMAKRTALQGEKIILANGGKREVRNGETYLLINRGATFSKPLELPLAPALIAEQNKAFYFDILTDKHASNTFDIVAGKLPDGLKLQGGVISGKATQTGQFSFTVALKQHKESVQQTYQINVFQPNLAPFAKQVISNSASIDDKGTKLNIIADGKYGLKDGLTHGQTYYSKSEQSADKTDFYGYLWDEPQAISTLVFNPGYTTEYAGWFTSLSVEYLNPDGDWQGVDELVTNPKINFDNDKYLKGKYINHSLSFKKIQTQGIRIIGRAGGVQPDDQSQPWVYQTSIAELTVYP